MNILRKIIPTLLLFCLVAGVSSDQRSPPVVEYSPLPPALQKRVLAFNPQKLRMVDFNSETGNYLFRGNMPVLSNQFAYDELVKSMNQRSLEKMDTPLPEDFLILNFSLISTLNESHLLKLEEEFSNEHPDFVRLVHHPIYGALSSPDLYPGIILDLMHNIPFLDNVYRLVDRLQILMNQEWSRPRILFVHCKAGSDRAALVIGTYQMQYLGMSYHDVVKEAEEIAGRPLYSLQRRGLKWIAYYLRDKLNIQSVGEIH